MFINQKHKFLWIWVPKSAGTFIYNHPHIKDIYPNNCGNHSKFFEIEIDSNDVEKTKKEVVEICSNLLTNTVIEDYKITDTKE